MLAMRLQKLVTVMAPQRRRQQQQRRRHPVGVLHAALLLLCLVLLMRATVTTADARHVPSENDTEYTSSPARQLEEGGTPSQQVSPLEVSVLSSGDAVDDNLKDCAALSDSTIELCASAIDRRMLHSDYGPPEGNENTHPAGPLP